MNTHDIQELIIKEHYGLLTPEEREVLDVLLAQSGEARAMQQEVRSQVPEAEARGAMAWFDPARSYETVKARYRADKAAGRRNWRALAAAVLFVLVGAGAVLLRQRTVSPTGEEPYAVTLQLANGETLLLNDSGHRQIGLRDMVLTSEAGRLSVSTGKAPGGWNRLSVPAGKTYSLKLNDGTLVWLNSASAMRFPFNFDKDRRAVYVEGEAYFSVAPDAQRPFTVYSGAAAVQVLGTEFNVNAYAPGNIVTSLVQGKVRVTVAGNGVELRPGQDAVAGTDSLVQIQPSPKGAVGWREGVYYFENTSIADIAAVLERTFAVKVVADNQEVGTRTFRGRLYRQRGLQLFLDQLNSTGEVRFFWQHGVLHCQ